MGTFLYQLKPQAQHVKDKDDFSADDRDVDADSDDADADDAATRRSNSLFAG